MIYITAPYIIRTEIAPSNSNDLKMGELCFVDSRLVIGNSLAGHPNFNRVAFPYKNTEVLSETSPKIKSLIGEYSCHVEKQNIPFKVNAHSNILIGIADKEGGFVNPIKIYNTNISLIIKYSIISNNDGRIPFRNGTFRSIGNATQYTNTIESINISAVDNQSVPSDPFTVLYNLDDHDGLGNYHTIQYENTTDFDHTIIFSYVLVTP